MFYGASETMSVRFDHLRMTHRWRSHLFNTIFRDTLNWLGHFAVCSFSMLGQLQLSWAQGHFKG